MKGCRQIEIRANGLRFAAYERGQGPLVLCLHGFPDHARSFRHQVEPLAAAGFRVVAPFMRGYAPTERPADGNYQTAALAHDVDGLIQALGEKDAIVFGHDWGAIAAYAAAVTRPERVRKLVVSAVPYGPVFLARFVSDYAQLKRSWYVFFFQQSFLAEAALAADRCQFVRNIWQDWSPTWTLPEAEVDAVRETIGQPGGVEAAIAYYRSMIGGLNRDPALADEQAKLDAAPAISASALYIHGADDGCLGVDLREGMEALFPSGLRDHVIQGAGHFVHQEKPEEFNRLLLDFLAG
jgi:pimeloyl-ACP methyl ester carboxylesterase